MAFNFEEFNPNESYGVNRHDDKWDFANREAEFDNIDLEFKSNVSNDLRRYHPK